MRAINLLPADLRGAAPSAPSARPEPAQGIGAYVVLGALALCVALFAAYVLASNSVKQKQTDLADITTRSAAAAQRAAALKPYADFQALANARVQTVRDLAAARFDWEQALRDLSRVIPADVKLSSLNGDMGLPGTTGSGADPLRGSIQAPAVTLTGCAASQASVAKLMAHLRGVDGVTRVSLSKSEKAVTSATSGTQTSACGGDNPPTFSAIVFFEGSAAAAALASSGVDASSVPVPAALDKPAADESASKDGSAPPATADAPASTEQGGTTGTTTNTNTSNSGATAP